MHKRWFALFLALLLALPAGCGGPDTPPDASSMPAPAVSQPDASTPPDTSGAVSAAAPAEPVDPHATDYYEGKTPWESGRALAPEQMPDRYNGLELPVYGATGYASTPLPLWPSIETYEATQEALDAWNQAQAEQGEELPGDLPDFSQPDDLELDGPAPVVAAAQAELPGGDEPQAPDTAEQPGEDAPSEPEAPPAEPGTDPEPQEPGVPAGPDAPDGEENPDEEENPEPTATDGIITTLPSGTPFTILNEVEDWWEISVEADYEVEQEDGTVTTEHGKLTGWVQHLTCLINLPDVIPSMLYDATNSYSSRFVTCGKAISGITAQALYPGATYNERLGEKEFNMPVLYSMAFRVCQAQRSALAEGNTLILYEGYRPHEVQTKVLGALSAMTRQDAEVKQAVTAPPWQISWFISGGYSNHQRGYAMDVGLAKVTSLEERSTGGHRYVRVKDYEMYQMPTPIHELSREAATFTKPVAINSTTAWKTAELSPGMNQEALALQRYCTGADLTPLASEWWHFNDLHTRELVFEVQGIGDFTIDGNRSAAPVIPEEPAPQQS